MKKTSLALGVGTLALAVALPLSTSAASGAGGKTTGGVDPLSTDVRKTFRTTAGGGTTATVSSHGNVVDYLSPDSASAGRYEHMGVGAIGEGYVLCYRTGTGTFNAHDLGSSETNFGPSTVLSETATAITVQRDTTDGKVTLTQTLSFDGRARAVTVKMTVKNNTASPIPGTVIRRQVDFDVDTGGVDGWAGFRNWHARTSLTGVFAWNDPAAAPADKEAHGMLLRFIASSDAGARSTHVTSDILDTSCRADSRLGATPQLGDFGDTLLYEMGTLPSNGSKFVTVEYARF